MPGGFYGGFEFDYPTWTVAGKEDATSVATVKDDEAGRDTFLQFTDDDLAQRFLDGAGWFNCEPTRVESRESLIRLLNAVRAVGVTHLGVDVPPLGQPICNTLFYRIEDAIRSLEEQG